MLSAQLQQQQQQQLLLPLVGMIGRNTRYKYEQLFVSMGPGRFRQNYCGLTCDQG